MQKEKRNKNKLIWLSVLILLICIALTILILAKVLNNYLPTDSGAISLIPESSSQDISAGNVGGETSTSSTQQTTSEFERNPGFQVSDNEKIWNTNTAVDIFKVSYENDKQIVTVKSSNKDKVIAPGTKNSYVFKLKNTGNVALDYKVEIDAFSSLSNTPIPITARICRYDGRWILGDSDNYASATALDEAYDTATLGAGKFTYYTLDWEWPFEVGNSLRDSQLGSISTWQDLTFTIIIRTTAVESNNPYGEGGITSPETGDNSDLTLWLILAVSSFALLIFLLFFKKDEEDDERTNAEAEKLEKA